MIKRIPRGMIFFAALFIASLIASTLLGSKLILLFGITVSAGLFIFPFTFVALEIITEIYGPQTSRFLVSCGIGIQLYVLFFVWLGGALPSSPVRDLGPAYDQVFSLAPRMVLASITAYACSQFLDILLFEKIRKRTGPRFLWLRANLSTYLSQALDTALFTLIFLGGVLPWSALWAAGLTSYAVKIAIGTLDTPLVYLGVALAKRLDQRGEKTLAVRAIKTEIFEAGRDLNEFIIHSLKGETLREGTVIAITSKIVSLFEEAVVAKHAEAGTEAAWLEKRKLIEKEADTFITETVHRVSLTVKHGIFIPSAGIDESNSQKGEFILFPKDPYASAKRIGQAMRAHYQIKNLGIILTDSHTTPLRNGVSGIGLSHYGFKAVRNLIGKPDLFGRDMKMTQVNLLDSLSVAAVLEMGETNDCCPLALIETNGLEFTDESSLNEIHIPLDQDLYGVFFKKALVEKDLEKGTQVRNK